MDTLKLKASELELGDVIRLSNTNEPYADYTVRSIDERQVHLFGVYVTTADFTYTGGVITYVGTRDFSIWKDSDRTYHVIRRQHPEETRRKVRGIVDDIRAALDRGESSKARELLRQL